MLIDKLQAIRKQSMGSLYPIEQIYVKRIEKLIGCEIILISTSPERHDTIYLKNPFKTA